MSDDRNNPGPQQSGEDGQQPPQGGDRTGDLPAYPVQGQGDSSPAFPGYPPQGQPGSGVPPQGPQSPNVAPPTGAPQPHPGYGQPQSPQPHPGYGPQPPTYGQPQGQPPQSGPQPHPGYGQPQAQTPQWAQGNPNGSGRPPKRGLSVGALIGIIGGGVFLLLVIGVIVAIVVIRSVASPAGGGTSQSASPSQVVTEYLTAIADGDAEKALGYLGTPPEDKSLLTDDVLAASNELAPLTGVSVVTEDTSNGSSDVTVTYQLGSQPVTAEYSVLDYDDDGVWEISGGTGYISTSKFEGLGLTINGTAVPDGDEVEVFPGSYQLATTSANFTLSGDATVVVDQPFGTADTSDITPALTDAALQQFRGLVRAAVEGCIASTTLDAGCGLAIPATLSDGTQLTDGTIQRTLPADTSTTIDSLEVTLSYDNPTLAQGESIGGIDVSAQCTQGGQTGTCSVLFGPSLGRPSVDMASPNPTVLWD
ncbi:hypothetical protein NY547_11020 [Cnuibacter physcomitrellae]|uniref:hypothetical protein n=1 Tax=Cnuibacter physcomitrellae TaxID=1619308 RepID=UPI002175E494|nr:hypothetical protein [Cnuibacter physcomitrellae]MCS5497768.1 hypothetical protein [Cnuibacter physcomitrellae]